jgi:hypothetical protein
MKRRSLFVLYNIIYIQADAQKKTTTKTTFIKNSTYRSGYLSLLMLASPDERGGTALWRRQR